MEKTKIWIINQDKINEVQPCRLDFEERLHNWILQELAIISSDSFIIGSKVKTDHNKEIDILAMDSNGDLIIIELKRDMTPREVVAQALDYTAWASELKEEDINLILQKQGNKLTIEELFDKSFPSSEIDEFNENQKILIVGTSIDPITERIVKYLSKKSVDINVVTFSYYKNDKIELLSKNYLLSPSDFQSNTDSVQRKRDKSFVKQLFENNILKVGDRVFYKPAIDNGMSKSDKRISATVINTGTKCLQRENGEETLYSFSKLRRIIVTELKIPDIKANWGFGSRYEWTNESGDILAEL